MKLGTFAAGDQVFPGLVVGDGAEIRDLSALGFSDLKSILAAEDAWRRIAAGADSCRIRRRAEVRVLPPLPNPGKIICIGRNYLEHARETGSEAPEEPVFFSKFNTAIIGPEDAIVLPRISNRVDYEAELAVIIGKRGKRIPRERAMEHVAGYTAFNDVSARDLQFRDGQWIKGKTLDTFAPMGPYLVTADEVGDPRGLSIKLWLNGRLMQDSTTDEMIFDIPYLIAFLSELFTFEPGDVIATGTPPGVGFARKPPVFLRPGDEVRIAVERVGELVNKVKGPET